MRTTKQGILIGFPIVLGFAVICLLFAGTGRTTQPTTQRLELERLIYSVKGPDLFRAHCAPCHGEDAKGSGPMAPALKTAVPDLTVLAKNHGGQFPANRVRKMIAGDEISAAHGSREMPIWGPVFHQIEWDQDLGNVRLENLVKYLQSIQASGASVAPAATAAPPDSSGAELYMLNIAPPATEMT